MGYRHSADEILDAAVAITLESGLAALTFSRVGERLEISDRTVVYYFPTKLDLINAVAGALVADMVQLLEEAFGSTTAQPEGPDEAGVAGAHDAHRPTGSSPSTSRSSASPARVRRPTTRSPPAWSPAGWTGSHRGSSAAARTSGAAVRSRPWRRSTDSCSSGTSSVPPQATRQHGRPASPREQWPLATRSGASAHATAARDPSPAP